MEYLQPKQEADQSRERAQYVPKKAELAENDVKDLEGQLANLSAMVEQNQSEKPAQTT
jgi:hypothetical protein